jgi:hypothetical protein
MTAKPSQPAAGSRPKRWTLEQFRTRVSDLRGDPLDVDAWHTLQRWVRWFAFTGWVTAMVLALAAAYLALFCTSLPVPFVQEEHGIVSRLITYPSPGAALHGN